MRSAIQDLLADEPRAALTAAGAAGYTLCRDGDAVLLRPVATASGHAWLALRPSTAQGLAAALPAENITACNPGAGVDQDVRLCGTTNTQGRLVNGSVAPCTQSAPSSADRFLHLEQSLTVRNNAQTVIDALDAVLP